MKDLLLFIAVVLVYAITGAQTNSEKTMQKGFELWKNNHQAEAVVLFEDLAKTESDNWLPSYYAAQINIVRSFDEQDENTVSKLLEGAQANLNKAKTISEDNPEILVLQALLYTSKIAHYSQTNAPLLSEPVERLYHEATQIAPNNPRVIFCKAEWDMHVAQYFGDDSKTYCSELERALELFTKFKPKSPWYPNWGESRAKQLVKSCN